MNETFRYDVLNIKTWKYIIIKKKFIKISPSVTWALIRMPNEDPTHIHPTNLFPQPQPILYRKYK